MYLLYAAFHGCSVARQVAGGSLNAYERSSVYYYCTINIAFAIRQCAA